MTRNFFSHSKAKEQEMQPCPMAVCNLRSTYSLYSISRSQSQELQLIAGQKASPSLGDIPILLWIIMELKYFMNSTVQL